jgi:hypothetical protein
MSPEVCITDTVGDGPQPGADLTFLPVAYSRVVDDDADVLPYAGQA